MVTEQQITDYVQRLFNEENVSDRIEDRGFAYYIDMQPREYLETNDMSKMNIGNGPLVVVKANGEVYTFSSNPTHMFGVSESRIGVNAAKTADEFSSALNDLIAQNDYSALTATNLTAKST